MSTLKAPRRRVNWFKRDWRLYTMLAIPVIWYLLFCYKPMIGVIIAFQKYSLVKGMWGSRWVGLDNFEFVMGLRDFPLALQNTLLLNLMGLIMGFPVPIILAIMLIIVGYLLYKEPIKATKIIGVAVCLAGLFLINK